MGKSFMQMMNPSEKDGGDCHMDCIKEKGDLKKCHPDACRDCNHDCEKHDFRWKDGKDVGEKAEQEAAMKCHMSCFDGKACGGCGPGQCHAACAEAAGKEEGGKGGKGDKKGPSPAGKGRKAPKAKS